MSLPIDLKITEKLNGIFFKNAPKWAYVCFVVLDAFEILLDAFFIHLDAFETLLDAFFIYLDAFLNILDAFFIHLDAFLFI